MTRRERLMATLRGEPVDRPAVSFYEIGGFNVDPDDADEFNVYNDPSWRPLLELAEEQTDLIRMRGPKWKPSPDNARAELFQSETYREGRSRFTRTTLTVAGRTMTTLNRRDADTCTVWCLEHLLKDTDDLKAYLQLPDEVLPPGPPDVTGFLTEEKELGDRGILMLDTGDPLCSAAPLFSMEDYLVLAMTEQKLFHRLLEKLAPPIHERAERASAALPGRMWRICGPEYATEPYLPPRLFREYVIPYTAPIVEAIHRHGGCARIHCHGRIKAALPHIMQMNPDAIDPIEPPPLGDVELADVRREYGDRLVLFGNIEIRDIEIAPPDEFERIVAKTLEDGTAGKGRGFVLLPTACPIGRKVTERALTNYRTMARLAKQHGG